MAFSMALIAGRTTASEGLLLFRLLSCAASTMQPGCQMPMANLCHQDWLCSTPLLDGSPIPSC